LPARQHTIQSPAHIELICIVSSVSILKLKQVFGENRPELEPQSTDGFQCVIFIPMQNAIHRKRYLRRKKAKYDKAKVGQVLSDILQNPTKNCENSPFLCNLLALFGTRLYLNRSHFAHF